jgi:hypothetical protein
MPMPAFAPIGNPEAVEFDAGTVDNPADAVGVGMKVELGIVEAAVALELDVDADVDVDVDVDVEVEVVGRSLLCQLIWMSGA